MSKICTLTLATLITLFSAAQSRAQSDEAPDWTISMGFGVGNWDYFNEQVRTDSTVELRPNSQQNTRGPALNLTLKKSIAPQWTIDLSYLAGTEIEVFAPHPYQSIQRAAVELSHHKWWKYGYLSGGLGLGTAMISGPGDSLIQEAQCDGFFICPEPDEYNTVYEFFPGITFTTDIGLRYGYVAIGVRHSSMLITEGFSQFAQLHADFIF